MTSSPSVSSCALLLPSPHPPPPPDTFPTASYTCVMLSRVCIVFPHMLPHTLIHSTICYSPSTPSPEWSLETITLSGEKVDGSPHPTTPANQFQSPLLVGPLPQPLRDPPLHTPGLQNSASDQPAIPKRDHLQQEGKTITEETKNGTEALRHRKCFQVHLFTCSDGRRDFLALLCLFMNMKGDMSWSRS